MAKMILNFSMVLILWMVMMTMVGRSMATTKTGTDVKGWTDDPNPNQLRDEDQVSEISDNTSDWEVFFTGPEYGTVLEGPQPAAPENDLIDELYRHDD